MFHYFGYGSNMSLASLRAKGVSPLSSEPAVLSGWRLTFNIPDFFRIEGGTGNIDAAPDSEVHGVLYGCRNEDLSALDTVEALGVAYERRELTVRTYSGREVDAKVYVGIPSRLAAGFQPSSRYLTIIVRGAEEMGLDPDYVAALRRIATWKGPEYGTFVVPDTPDRIFSLDELASTPLHTAIAGAVFDMRRARPDHGYLLQLLERRDVTVFFLKRLHDSGGSETLEDFIEGRLTPSQRKHLNDYLHEFSREYRFAGRLRYDSRKQRRTPRQTRRWERGDVAVPARHILDSAERTNRQFGHENLGFLSAAHGFMPAEAPALALPPPFSAFDELVAELPKLHASLRLRRRMAEIDVLDASEQNLPDAYLLRAAAVLAMLSHAYFYVETSPPESLPANLAMPWRQVRERLGRDEEVLSYIDLIVYNWRLIDRAAPDPMRLENMRLLIPTVDTDEERRFYLSQTEILARCSPIIGDVVNAQEAAARDEPARLEAALGGIITALERVVRDSLLKINPNPSGPTHIDPVIWAKTVAPFAVPFKPGPLGPSGTSSPIFNLLDSFFGRKKHESFLGREIRQLRAGYPRFWREFLSATEAVSVADYIQRIDNPSLTGLLKEAVNVYAGENGFLGRHRMKVYGYLEIAFKVGRSVTIGGFAGIFRDRTWDEVDTELESARVERLETFPSSCHYATVTSVTSPSPETPEGVRHIVLDVSGSGVRYEPGDRCGVLPQNDDRLVERTLAALQATGDEPIALTDEWRRAVALRPEHHGAITLPLRDVLRFGRIRPVVPRVAEALHATSQNPMLSAALEEQTTTRWELWDLVERLEREGFDPRSLWQCELSALHHVCRVVPPETFRMYSIASAMSETEVSEAKEIHLTVGRIAYRSAPAADGDDVERRGTASNFLADSAGRAERVAFFVEHPPRFSLPEDPRTPIVLFAAGTGISPFRSFLFARSRQKHAAPAHLFFAARSRDHLLYRDDLRGLVAEGMLSLSVAFSRDDASLDFEDGDFVIRPGQRRYIDELMLEEGNATRLAKLIRSRSEGGEGAHIYVCGRSRFSRSVHEACKTILSRHDGGPPEGSERRAEETLRRLAGEGRYLQEIFTDAHSQEPRETFPVSEITRHNDDERGHWVVIDQIVYDVSEFIHLHPGGRKLLEGYAGMDATQGYMRAHSGHSEVHAMLEMYEIGAVRRPDFADVYGTMTQRSGDDRGVSLSAFYDLWVDATYLIVEMENALRNDQSLQIARTARGDSVRPRAPYKLQRSIETHQRFVRSYLDGFFGEPSAALWRYTQGLCGDGAEDEWFATALADVYDGHAALFLEQVPDALTAALEDIIEHDRPTDSPQHERLARACELLEREDLRFLAELASVMREGIRTFEHHEAATFERASHDLLAAARQLPEILAFYCERIRDALRDEGWQIEVRAGGRRRVPLDERQKLEVLASSSYWMMEEDRERRIVVLTRSAVPVETLESLVEQNELVIGKMPDADAGYGIVVDMRQAPQRNDPEFERAMERLRREIDERHLRVSVLLMSAMGVLQVRRIGRSDEVTTFVTQSREAAVKFAMGQGRALREPS